MIGWNQLPYTSNKDVLSKQNPAARIGMGFGVDFLPFPGVAIWIVQFEVKGFLQCLGIKRKVRLENLKLLSSYKTWPALISTILSQVTTRKTYTHLFQDFTRSYQHQLWNPYAHLPLIVGYQKEATHSQMLSRCPKLQPSYTHPFPASPISITLNLWYQLESYWHPIFSVDTVLSGSFVQSSAGAVLSSLFKSGT